MVRGQVVGVEHPGQFVAGEPGGHRHRQPGRGGDDAFAIPAEQADAGISRGRLLHGDLAIGKIGEDAGLPARDEQAGGGSASPNCQRTCSGFQGPFQANRSWRIRRQPRRMLSS